jgi:hypothetical protein
LTIGSLSPAQRDAETRLLQVLLSSKGYQKVLGIMGSDQALADGGTPFCSGTAYYTLAIFLGLQAPQRRGCCSTAAIISRSTSP